MSHQWSSCDFVTSHTHPPLQRSITSTHSPTGDPSSRYDGLHRLVTTHHARSSNQQNAGRVPFLEFIVSVVACRFLWRPWRKGKSPSGSSGTTNVKQLRRSVNMPLVGLKIDLGYHCNYRCFGNNCENPDATMQRYVSCKKRLSCVLLTHFISLECIRPRLRRLSIDWTDNWDATAAACHTDTSSTLRVGTR